MTVAGSTSPALRSGCVSTCSVALALIGYWQLRHYHGVLVDNRGGLGIDPFLVAAPAVLLVAGALLSLRLVPLVASLVERLMGGTRGVVAALGFRQIARRPRGYSRSILLLVLAVAIGVFAATYSETWHRSQVDQAGIAAGVDVLVDPRAGRRAADDRPRLELPRARRDSRPAGRDDSFDFAAAGGATGNLLALDTRRARGHPAARRFLLAVVRRSRPPARRGPRPAGVRGVARPAGAAGADRWALTIPTSTIEPPQGTEAYIDQPVGLPLPSRRRRVALPPTGSRASCRGERPSGSCSTWPTPSLRGRPGAASLPALGGRPRARPERAARSPRAGRPSTSRRSRSRPGQSAWRVSR